MCIEYELYELSLVDESLSSSLRNYQTSMETIIINYNKKLCSWCYSFSLNLHQRRKHTVQNLNEK